MASLTTPAIILRRVEYGDYDLILTFLSLERGKLSAIAKTARKSTRRFGGILELFSNIDIVCSTSRRNGLLVLQEAVLKNACSEIRADIMRTAYASYWVELIDTSSEEGQKQPELYRLLQFTLCQLDQKRISPEALSVLFQLRLLLLSGYRPNLRNCRQCQRTVGEGDFTEFQFDLAHGGLLCQQCMVTKSERLILSKSTLKQLHWIESGGLYKAGRVRLSGVAIRESLRMLEAFVPYQLGKEPRSLKFLQQIRGTTAC
jgi:DNA repair protein RecO (recombination protein O)